jgi:sugar/nucleoside kinase (ribokinase family)
MRPLRILCIGGAAVDHIYEAEGALALNCSNPVSGRSSFGGVARNAAEVLSRLGAEALLASVIGEDRAGEELVQASRANGIDVSLLRRVRGARTAAYAAAFEQGELFTAFADMGIFESLGAAFVLAAIDNAPPVDAVLADCNLQASAIEAVRRHCLRKDLPLAIGTVSPAKAARLGRRLDGLTFLFTNRAEAEPLSGTASPEKAVMLLQSIGAARIVLSEGPRGCHCCGPEGYFHLPMPECRVRNVNGAGDALAAGSFLRMLEGAGLREAVLFGMGCAQAALEQPSAGAGRLDRRDAERRSRLIAQGAPC